MNRCSHVIQVIFIAITICSLTSCASFLGFKSKTPCDENTDRGKCQSIEQSYIEAIGAKGGLEANGPSPAEEEYRRNEYNRLASLIKAPVAPIVAPPSLVRVLVFPYGTNDDETLYMPQYVFFLEKRHRFMIGDYLVGNE